MQIEQVASFEPRTGKTTEGHYDNPTSNSRVWSVHTVKKEPTIQQKEKINKLLRYMIDKIGTTETIELLEELKRKIDYTI